MMNQGPRSRSEVATQEPEIAGKQQQAYTPHGQDSSYGGSSEYWSSDPESLSPGQSSGDEGPQTSIALGRKISKAFNANSEDVTNTNDHIFDTTEDYNDDDDADVDDDPDADPNADPTEIGSSASSVYEELEPPTERWRPAEPVKSIPTSDWDADTNASDESYIPTSEEEEYWDSGEDGEDGEYGEDEEYEEDEENGKDKEYKDHYKYDEEEDAWYKMEWYGPNSEWADDEFKNNEDVDAVFLPGSFASLQANPSPPKALSLNQYYERTLWRIQELEEIRGRVKRQLRRALRLQVSTKKKLEISYDDYYLGTKDLGISMGLWKEYQAFCESMEPQFGSTNGWSITCDEDHKGSYIGYDPEMVLFKKFCELPPHKYNFRCEASVQTDNSTVDVPVTDLYVVEFWPVACLPINTNQTSWSDVYFELYHLAEEAAREGSEAALDMLVALPDRDGTYGGGWLFEYSKEKATTYSDVSDAGNTWPTRRWVYRSAHRTVDPAEDAATKRKRIQEFLKVAE